MYLKVINVEPLGHPFVRATSSLLFTVEEQTSILRARKASSLYLDHLTDGNVLSTLSNSLDTMYFPCTSCFCTSVEAVPSIRQTFSTVAS